ncbi:helix-turn-helix domain-containing protein [Gordonia amicalis]|uniref:helix-turn-helix domain-containing protein n=1 Tax=Gordonia amicalis TaxID=89053 RepID=UPI0029531232|nr:helix-turn-helix domain-containing protein [Gordonia amicalis]MDV7101658.1 helix-turn-helix domain-containing protein [Gordonia amicalis]
MPTIEPISGVLLGVDDARVLSEALDVFVGVLAERGSQPTAKLDDLRRRLSRANTRVSTENTRVHARQVAPQPDSGVHLGYELIDTARAAAILGITPDGVRDLARRGVLPAVRAGGRWLLASSAVVARADRGHPENPEGAGGRRLRR